MNHAQPIAAGRCADLLTQSMSLRFGGARRQIISEDLRVIAFPAVGPRHDLSILSGVVNRLYRILCLIVYKIFFIAELEVNATRPLTICQVIQSMKSAAVTRRANHDGLILDGYRYRRWPDLLTWPIAHVHGDLGDAGIRFFRDPHGAMKGIPSATLFE
jgi:hypothetical protein